MKMRILIVNTCYYPDVQGGAEYSVKKLAEQLVSEGHRVLVLCSDSRTVTETVNGVRVHRHRFHSVYHRLGNDSRSFAEKLGRHALDTCNPLNAHALEQIIGHFRPDVIHTNNLYEITPQIWLTAKKFGVPVVHTLRDYALLCPRTTLTHADGSPCGKPNPVCAAHRAACKAASAAVMAVTAPSEMMLERFAEEGFFPKASKQTVPNAADFDPETVARLCREKRTGETVTFVFLGTLSEHKGVRVLLDAFGLFGKSDPSVRLVIAGKGELEDMVKTAAAHDSRITYAGFLNETEVGELLVGCDVLVCPSVWNEPFGRVVLDAYKHGLPVIASRAGALPETVTDGVTGVLVPQSDTAALHRAMNRMTDHSLLEKMRTAIPEKLAPYSLSSQSRCFTSIYLRVLT
ncbi:Glycosyltransferase involved in cell wall bisynthesis [Ruminococcus sp. YE71]|uniref:glycosyltransferase family 4 protein n=1 Tax=unclassified Ruminococcus TaxID=2608920 RepID=UPI0008911E12|nr:MULTISPECIES: glycosyltransferase family 4 protein [unclassified Ruminococcus]SDA18186.1 Glycosyltransferase involved in cell wall bisynthesis [Ruminococcus sp. YE78]SFW30325.1 Glycosyltransferase involved in cell wall bisynthesis [Ruminococcus sp. YE71]